MCLAIWSRMLIDRQHTQARARAPVEFCVVRRTFAQNTPHIRNDKSCNINIQFALIMPPFRKAVRTSARGATCTARQFEIMCTHVRDKIANNCGRRFCQHSHLARRCHNRAVPCTRNKTTTSLYIDTHLEGHAACLWGGGLVDADAARTHNPY